MPLATAAELGDTIPFVSQGLKRALPNVITVGRLVLAAAFFGVLLWLPVLGLPEQQGDRQGIAVQVSETMGTTAVVLFIIAALTDILDGYLARKWNVVSVFGRVMDPFCDKILVLGALVLLAAPPLSAHSGIRAWMVVLLLGRELYVTSVRAVAESEGVPFPADVWGKLKMFLQCVAIPFAIFVGTHPGTQESVTWLAWRDWTTGAMVVATILSLVPYLIRSRAVFTGKGGR